MNYYEQNLADYKEELVYHPHLNRRTGNYIQKTGSSIYACTHAVIKPSEDTLQEITALRLLFEMDCASAPHLVELAQGMVRPDMEAGIVGGYIVMILMTKMPGSELPYDTFCKMPKVERDKVREAFRRAIT
jgi:hypothetical protein